MIDVGIATAAISVDAPVPDEEKHDQRGENAAQNQVLLHGVERIGDELRLIARVRDLEVRRQRLLQLGDARP